jgi:hypothetical protein
MSPSRRLNHYRRHPTHPASPHRQQGVIVLSEVDNNSVVLRRPHDRRRLVQRLGLVEGPRLQQVEARLIGGIIGVMRG